MIREYVKITFDSNTDLRNQFCNSIIKLTQKCIFLCILLVQSFVYASPYPKVDKDIAIYDQTVEKMKSDFLSKPADPKNKTWVQLKIDNMVQIDQYMRKFWDTPFINSYSADEKAEFNKQFSLKSSSVDSENTSDLKELLKIYNWFRISEFGATTDNQAWLLVQHADQDHDFQESSLKILETLWPLGETKPSNYAYLYDRVASSFGDPSKRKSQRYGTQGHCVGPGLWEPWPMENPEKVDELRKSVGLGSMEEYKKVFKDICH